MFGICPLPYVPVRKEPSDASEMVTQLLFGETYKIIIKKEKWLYIQNDADEYQGWVNNKQSQAVTEKEYQALGNLQKLVTSDTFAEIAVNNEYLRIPCGSILYKDSNSNFHFPGCSLHIENNLLPDNSLSKNEIITTQAIKLKNTPYLWGGRSSYGIDCSGLVQLCFRVAGLQLLRDASQQVNHGKVIDFLENAQPGDVAFFDNTEGNIVHIGILLSTKEIIHASGMVRIDTIDHQGIFNNLTKKYTHKLRVIKRLV